MKNPPRRHPVRGLLSTTAVLSLTVAGLSLVFAPATTAAAPTQPPGSRYFNAQAGARAASVQDYNPNTGLSKTARSGLISASASQGSDMIRLASGDVSSYESPDVVVPTDVQARNVDSEPGGFDGTAALTGPAGSSDGFTFGSSANSLEVNQSTDPAGCLPLGRPLFETSTSSRLDVGARDFGTVGLADLLDNDGANDETHARGTMFAIPGTTDRRGVLTEAESSTGTFFLLNGTVMVDIAEPATARATADGVNPSEAEAVGATLSVTDLTTDSTYFFTDANRGTTMYFVDAGVRMQLIVNSGYESVSANNPGDWEYAAASIYAVSATYTNSSNNYSEGHVSLGFANAYAEVREGGLDCSRGDADGDGLIDTDEALYGTDPFVTDSDDDGLTDGDEVHVYDTDPTNPDTDDDGVDDGTEVANGTNPWDEDTDRDNLTDGGEVTAGTDPLVQDTDGDNLWDGDEVRIGSSPLKKDTDGGSVNDDVEYDRGTNPLDPSDDVAPAPPVGPVPPVSSPPVVLVPEDADNDGLTDGEERVLGTNPFRKNSDEDGLTDGEEVGKTGTNPLKKDTDKDGLGDFREVRTTKTNPLVADTDSDGLTDGVEVKGFVNEEFGLTFKSNPRRKDTDRDGLNDKVEVTGARNWRFDHQPTNPKRRNTDRSGGKDLREIKAGSNPADATSAPRNP